MLLKTTSRRSNRGRENGVREAVSCRGSLPAKKEESASRYYNQLALRERRRTLQNLHMSGRAPSNQAIASPDLQSRGCKNVGGGGGVSSIPMPNVTPIPYTCMYNWTYSVHLRVRYLTPSFSWGSLVIIIII